jgi:CRISPR-associated protein Cas5d
MLRTSTTLSLRVSGPFALFTRPELKAERVSYQVMTPSAARGILEAIVWKPAIRWRIERIHVLSPIRWVSFRRNELSTPMATPSQSLVRSGGLAPLVLIEDDRAQRNAVALRDVDYVIDSHFELTDRAGPDDNVNKFAEIFARRLRGGQHWSQPYLGCREFVAHVEPVDETTPKAINQTQDLGLMLWDIDFQPGRNRPRFFHGRLDRGILEVPSDSEASMIAREGGVP